MDNIVHIKGLVKDGTIRKSVFTLPEGARPNQRVLKATYSDSNVGRIDIDTDGKVLVVDGSDSWFSVECSFII